MLATARDIDQNVGADQDDSRHGSASIPTRANRVVVGDVGSVTPDSGGVAQCAFPDVTAPVFDTVVDGFTSHFALPLAALLDDAGKFVALTLGETVLSSHDSAL